MYENANQANYYPQQIGIAGAGPTFTTSGPMPPQSTPIHNTVQALDKHITHLHEMLTELERRLEPMLTPSVPTPSSGQGNAAGAVQAGSAHQMTLANLGFGVMTSVERVNRLLGRLEI